MNQFSFLKDEVLQKGEVFDQYVVIEEISRGGMGIIYKCQSSHRIVAVKFLLKQACDHISNKRLLREANVLAELQHPNIVSVYSAGVYKDQLYIVMEFIEGQPLETFSTASLTIHERVLLISRVFLLLRCFKSPQAKISQSICILAASLRTKTQQRDFECYGRLCDCAHRQ